MMLMLNSRRTCFKYPYLLRALSALLLCAAGYLLHASPSPTIYESNFSGLPDGNASLDAWALTGGNYRMDDGRLIVNSKKSNPVATLKKDPEGDGTFRATVTNARSCHWCAIVAKSIYKLEINNQFVRMALHRRQGDEWSLVAEAGGPYKYARNTQTFELRLAFRDDTVYGFIDDKKLIEYEDPEPTEVGKRCQLRSGWGTDLEWHDVRLSDKPDLSEWPYEQLPASAPPDLLQVTKVRALASDGIYFDNEAAGFRIWAKTARAEANPIQLQFRVIDVNQNKIAEKSRSVSLDNTEKELRIEFSTDRRGCFKVALFAAAEGKKPRWVEDIGSFTVVPRALYEADFSRHSYFGGHTDAINLQWHLRAAKKIGIRWARCHDMMQWTWWERIQPDGPETWRWHDDAQSRVDDLGFHTLGEFCRTASWASAKEAGQPGHPKQYPPQNWDDLAEYVYRTVDHYKDSIHHWEVWNEPHYSGFWRGGPDGYARLLKTAYTQAKKADPECTVFGGGGVNPRSLQWIKDMFDHDVGSYMDGFTIHYLEPDIADQFMPQLSNLLHSHDINGPVWNSEASVPTTSFLDQIRKPCVEPQARYHFRNACYELVRMYMENISNGIRRVFYYNQADPWRWKMHDKPRVDGVKKIDGGMWDQGRAYKPIAAAHAAVAFAIGNRRYTSSIDAHPLQAFIFADDESAVAVHYADFQSFKRREQLQMAITENIRPTDLTVIDFMGNESEPEIQQDKITLQLSRQPVYLMYCGNSAQSTLRTMYSQCNIDNGTGR